MTLDEYIDVIVDIFDLDAAHWMLVDHEQGTMLFFRPDGHVDDGADYPEPEEYFFKIPASGLASPEMYAGDWAEPLGEGYWRILDNDGNETAELSTMEMVHFAIFNRWEDHFWHFLETWLKPLIRENVDASLKQDAIAGSSNYASKRYQEIVEQVRELFPTLSRQQQSQLQAAEDLFFTDGPRQPFIRLVNKYIPGAFPRGEPAEEPIAVFWDAFFGGEKSLADFPAFILEATGRPVRVVDWWSLYWEWVSRGMANPARRRPNRRR